MGRKALVDYSLIKEICDNLRSTKKKFRGQLDLESENGPPKEGKKVKEVRRLLVTKANEKKSTSSKTKKRKRSPERFTQNSQKCSDTSSEDSSSDTATSCEESCSDNNDSDNLDVESDISADDIGETK